MKKVTWHIPIDAKLKVQLQALSKEMGISMNLICTQIVKDIIAYPQKYIKAR